MDTCATCIFSKSEGVDTACFRYPPQRTMLVSGADKLGRPVVQPFCGFPLVNRAWSCGEHQNKPIILNQ